MMLVPFAAILGSGLVGIWLSHNITPVLNAVGHSLKIVQLVARLSLLSSLQSFGDYYLSHQLHQLR